MSKILFSLTILLILCNCQKKSADNPQKDYLTNRSKWNSAKTNLSTYQITATHHWYGGSSSSRVVFDVTTDTVLSCELKTRDWNEDLLVTSDCLLETQYHKSVEDYFEEFYDLLLQNKVVQYSFDTTYGVPLMVLGPSPDPLQCADCSAPGFEIIFEVLD